MSDFETLEQRLADSLATSQPRGAGFPDRMAAGAMRRVQARRIKRRASAGALVLVAALVAWVSTAPANDEPGPHPDEAVVTPLRQAAGPGQSVEDPRSALLWVEAPFDDPVLVDGKRVGTANRPIEVAPGKHRVALFDSSRQSTEWSIDIGPGQWRRLLVDSAATAPRVDGPVPDRAARPEPPEPPIVRDEPPARSKARPSATCDEVTCLVEPSLACCKRPRTGELLLAAKPPAKIYIDGREVGMTPFKGEIRAGRHRVTLVVPSLGTRHAITVNVEPGETVRVIRDFTDAD